MGKWVSSTVTLPAIQFDGDSITVTAKRLLTSHMSALAGHYSNGKLSFANHMEMVTAAGKVLPEVLIGVEGMTTGEGAPFTKDMLVEVLGEYYFAPLVAEMLARLIEASSVQDPKNSSAPSPESSVASGAQTSVS